MKLLFLDNDAFAKLDMIEAFQELGFTVDLFYHDKIRSVRNPDFDEAFRNQVFGAGYDFVFSLNYYQQLSNMCEKYGLKYVSYIYDCPLVSLYSYTVLNKCNYIFLFDKEQYLTLHNAGIGTVYYLPLAANVRRLDAMLPTAAIRNKLDTDVSFVGSLYNESHNLFDTLQGLSEHTKGYLTAIMEAQLKVSGYFFIEELLTEPILADLQKARAYTPQPDGVETPAYVYANYFIARKLAELERTRLLSAVSERHPLKLYTHNPTPQLPKAENMGPIDYYDVMPYVFRCSKVNLNISLRSIRSGIPLRAFDIIGAGGFLLSNYQADFADCFVAGEDYDFYEDEPDLLQKLDYYLSHDSIREEMAANGHRKLTEQHTFIRRIRQILEFIS